GADNDETKAVVGGTVLRLKCLHPRGVAVVHGDDFTGTGQAESHPVGGAWHHQARLVANAHRDERKVLSICSQSSPVGRETYLSGRTGGALYRRGPFAPAFPSDNSQFTW